MSSFAVVRETVEMLYSEIQILWTSNIFNYTDEDIQRDNEYDLLKS